MRKELITFEDPKSPVSEVFRALRTNIQFAKKNGMMKTILITSTYMSEGKSWTSANLAVAFTQAGYKVLLIDADMRRGRQHHVFKLNQAPGLSNYLSSRDDLGRYKDYDIRECCQKTHIENLYVMTLGNYPENPAELLLTNKMGKCIESVSDEFDIVLIDASPSTMVTDSVILSRLVDGTLIVVEQNKSKMDDLKKISKEIKNVGGNIIGVVLNKVAINKKKYESRYYYKNETSNKQFKRKDAEAEAKGNRYKR